jgi:intracellular sulfur oxidation DsrE/DsrF family protein
MKNILAYFIIFVIPILGFTQTSKTLEDFGPVYEIEEPDFKVDLNQELKAVFDIAKISYSKDQPNRMFQTLARYIRIHSAPELQNNSVKAVMVLHGSAIYDLLTNEEYAKYHNQEGLKNPNLELLSLLSENNVEMVLCGQTSKHRKISKTMMHPDVKIALSAMTALIELQNKGYKLINF